MNFVINTFLVCLRILKSLYSHAMLNLVKSSTFRKLNDPKTKVSSKAPNQHMPE